MTQVAADVVVVGAGMAGASVAAELSKQMSVVVVEAEPVAGAHSTGRSAAAFLPSYGGPTIRRLTAASRPLYDARSAELGISILRSRPVIWMAPDHETDHVVAEMLRDNPTLERLTATEASRMFPPLREDRVVSAALDTSASDIDVSALHEAYLADLKRRSGTILLNAPAHDIRRSRPGWQVRAGEHQISCAKVVNAAGAWADEVARCAGVPRIGLQPKRRTAFISAPHWDGDIKDLPLLCDAGEGWYVKPEAGLALGSPADETNSPPGDARPDEIAIARAIDAINDATRLGLRSVRRAWAGLRSFVADRAPVLGAWADHDGFYFVAGQGGYGIQMAPALARVAAELVSEGTLSEKTRDYGVAAPCVLPDRLR